MSGMACPVRLCSLGELWVKDFPMGFLLFCVLLYGTLSPEKAWLFQEKACLKQ